MSFASQPIHVYPEEVLRQIEANLSFKGLQSVYSMIMQLPAGIAVFSGDEFVVQISNDTYLDLIGRRREEFIGRSLFEAAPELKGQQVERLLRNVLTTGKSYRGHEFKASLVRDGKREDAYFDFIYQALKSDEGKINGVIVVAYEVTESVNTKYLIAESERQFRNLVMKSPIAMTIFRGEEFTITLANETLLKTIWQRELQDVEGKKLLDVFPELNDQPFPNLLRKVYATGIAHSEKEALAFVTTGKGEKRRYYFDFEYSPLFEPDGKTTSAIMVTVIDVTEKVETRKKVEESESNLRRIADNMPAILFMSGKEGYFNYMNSQWYSYTGLTEEESKGFGWLVAVHPDQKAVTEKIIRSAIERGTSYNVEFKLRKNDGSYGWFVTSGKQSFNINQEPEGYVTTLMDIHERKLADETLTESRESVRMAIETAELGTWDFDPVTGQLQWDDRTKGMFGLPDHESVSFDLFLAGIHDEDRDRVNDAVSRAVTGENNGEYSIEYRVKRYMNSQQRWIRAKGKAFFNEQKILQRFLGTVYDITEQKESVQKIEVAEARLRLATEGTGTAVWDLDIVSGIIVHSPRMAVLFGHSADTVFTHPQLRAQIHPDDLHEIVEKAFDIAVQTGTYFYEARAVWPDKSVHWVRTHGRVMYNEANKPQRMLGVLQDITAEKQALILLQQSELRYRHLIYSLPLAFYTCDKDGRIGIYNDAAVELWGRQPGEDDRWTGSSKMYRPDGSVMPASECPMAITLKTGEIVRGEEIIVERPDGSRANVLPTPQLVFDEKGEIVGGINMLVNISERKIAEQNTARLAAIVQSSDDAIVSKTLDGIVRSWNPGAERLFGYSSTEMIGQPIAILIPNDRLDEENDILRRIGRGEQIQHFETIRMAKSGQLIDISLTVSPIRDAAGNITGASKIARDITRQRSLLRTLQDSEQRLQMAINAAELGTWEYLVSTKETKFNKRFLEIAGFEEHENPTDEQVSARIYPPDLATREKAVEAARQTGFIDMEIRYVHKDNSLHWARIRGKVFYDEANAPVKVIGTTIETTGQKEAFEALRESELLFKTIANVSPVGLWMTDKQARNNFVNETWIEWTGVPLQEQYNGGWMSRVITEDAIRVRKHFEKVMVTLDSFSDEFRLVRKDGEIRWCLTEGFPYYNNNGEFEGYAGSVTDITERKMIEDELEQKVYGRTIELKHANTALEKSNGELEQFAYVASHDLQEPLRKIKTFVSRLQEADEKNETQRKLYMEKIISAAARMSDLIHDLLEYSRTGKVSEAQSLVSLNSILESVKNDLELIVNQKKATIKAENLPQLYAVGHQMTQLFTNLLSNSLKFAKEEEPPVISITAATVPEQEIQKYGLEPGRKYTEIVFTDNGIGFSNEFSDRIFDIFQRLNPRSAYSGSGIGLSICRKIVSGHGGVIFADSTENIGTAFHIILPFGKRNFDLDPVKTGGGATAAG